MEPRVKLEWPHGLAVHTEGDQTEVRYRFFDKEMGSAFAVRVRQLRSDPVECPEIRTAAGCIHFNPQTQCWCAPIRSLGVILLLLMGRPSDTVIFPVVVGSLMDPESLVIADFERHESNLRCLLKAEEDLTFNEVVCTYARTVPNPHSSTAVRRKQTKRQR
jgi:hypothetical protein